jgi:hypothetical protein
VKAETLATAAGTPAAPMPAPPESLASGHVVNGYPAFNATLDALRYAETEHYSYPSPKTAPL